MSDTPAMPVTPASSLAVSGLLLIAVLTVLHLARDVVVPVVVALILSLVFLPAVRGMKKMHIPAPLGAALIVLGLVAAFAGGVYTLSEPAGAWLEKAPESLRALGVKLRHVAGSLQGMSKTGDQVQDMTHDMAGGNHDDDRAREVTMKTPTFAGGVLDAARGFALGATSTLVLLYFLLACGDLFLRKTIAATPRLADKERAVDIAQQVEAGVSAYLLTVTLINIALGCVVALAMALLGVPNAMLWGVLVAVLNFVPYLGEIASVAALTAVGLLSFDDLGHGLLVPGTFMVLSAIERYLVTPMVVGRRLSLNPVVIVLSVLFWSAMWGVPGALLAVPILVSLKTLCDRVERFQVFGEFLAA